MGVRYSEGGAWDQSVAKEAMAKEAMAKEIRQPTISDALELAGKQLAGLHAAISEVEQRTDGFRVPPKSPAVARDTTKPAGLSQVHMAIMDINTSLDDAMSRLNAIARTIDL